MGLADTDHWQSATHSSYITDVGSILNVFTYYDIIHYNGIRESSALSSYEITWAHGTLTVTPREIHIRPADKSKIYDGTALEPTAYMYCEDSPYELVDGHVLSLKYTGSIVNVGTANSYIVEKSIYVKSQDKYGGVDWVNMDNYRIVCDEPGILEVFPRPITVTTNSAHKYFDGMPLTDSGYTISSGSLVSGHNLEIKITGSQTEVGSSYNTAISSSVKIVELNYGGTSVDLTYNYKVTVNEGTLTVTDPNKRTITLKPSDVFKEFDGTYLYAVNHLEETGLLAELLSLGYYYDVQVSGKQLEVGVSESKITKFVLYSPYNVDVTDEFNLTFKTGTVEVREVKDVIEVFLYELQKYYDGTPLSFNEDDYSIIYIPDGCELRLELRISMTNVGEITLDQLNSDVYSYASYTVYKNGKDVTDKYTIVFGVYPDTHKDYVPLKISPRYIELTAASVEKYYDGNVLVSDRYEITKGALADRHYINVEISGYILDVGKTENKIIRYQIFDMYTGENVTNNYDVKTIPGSLVIQ